jgi:hypothetical protein
MKNANVETTKRIKRNDFKNPFVFHKIRINLFELKKRVLYIFSIPPNLFCSCLPAFVLEVSCLDVEPFGLVCFSWASLSNFLASLNMRRCSLSCCLRSFCSCLNFSSSSFSNAAFFSCSSFIYFFYVKKSILEKLKNKQT